MPFEERDWDEKVWKGASAGCGVFCMFVSYCAKEFGEEKVFSLLRKLGEDMGTGAGNMFKEQLGGQKLDVEKLAEFITGFNGPFGCQMEIEKHPTYFRLRHINCPIANGCKSMQVDYDIMKRVCEDWGVTLFRNITKQLSPAGKYELPHYRENFDDYCEEKYTP
jgi:hypothetical protein